MTQLINGNEVCDRCDKPYIPALNGVSCDCPSVVAVKKPVPYGVLKAENKAMYKALKRVIKHHDKMYDMRDAIFGAKIAISLVDGRE